MGNGRALVGVGVWSVGISLWGNIFNFKHIDHGQKSYEEQKEENKKSDGANEKGDIHPGRREVAPGGRQEVPVNGRYNNDKSLEPHTCVGKHDNGENDPWILAAVFKPKELGSGDVAGNHCPVRPPVRTESAIGEGIDFEGVTAVPSDKEFHGVGVANKGTGQQNDLTHIIDVFIGDEIMETIDFAKGNQEGEHHGESSEDGSGDKVRGENGGMPTWDDGGGEIKGNDAVHR